MHILMRVTSAGPLGVRLSGKTYSVSEKEGAELVKGGYAVAVAAPAPKAAPKAEEKPAEEAAAEGEKEDAADEGGEVAAQVGRRRGRTSR